MNKLVKIGNADNQVTYEHICDTKQDLNNIDPGYINLGSTAIVLQGEEGLEVYMASSQKEWKPIAMNNSSSDVSLDSPNFTGTPTAPTASANTNTAQIATTAFVKTAVENAISGVTQFQYEVVNSLPTSGETGKIYLITSDRGDNNNTYDEYIWVNNAYEKIGNNTNVDLSTAAPKNQGTEFIVSTHDYDSNEWTGVTTDSELYDGKQINYFLKNNNINGGNVTLTLIFPDGTKSRKCRVVAYGSKQITTEFEPNTMLHMVYTSGLRQWFITASAVPKLVSAFENDAGYINDVSALISRISALEEQVSTLTAAVAALTVPATAITNENGEVITDEAGNTIEINTPTT